MLRIASVAVLALATLAGCVSVGWEAPERPPGPRSGPFSSTSEAIEAAVVTGCLPYLAEGGSIYRRLRDANTARGGDLNGRRAARLYGGGDVRIQEDGQGGCYLRVVGAFTHTGVEDAARFRQAVLDLIPQVAGPLTTRSDSGPGFNDPVGASRQELHCFDLRGRPAWMLVTTSALAGRKANMQVSIAVDRDGTCAGVLPAPAPIA